MIFMDRPPEMPEALYTALCDSQREYSSEVKDFMKQQEKKYQHSCSVTALSKPVQAQILTQRHAHEMYVDPEKQFSSFFGNIVHFVLEKFAALDANNVTEFRMGAEINVDGVLCLIHGKYDLYKKAECELQDWKFTAAENMIYPKGNYEKQLNYLRYICEDNGWKVKRLTDIYLFPKLDKRSLGRPGYPTKNYLPVQVEMESLSVVKTQIINRLRLQLTEKDKKDSELLPCTREERWIRDSSWSIYVRKKQGPKDSQGKRDFSSRAAMHSPDKLELGKWRREQGLAREDVKYKEYVGEAKGCTYCTAQPFCHQYQHEQLEREKQAQENQ